MRLGQGSFLIFRPIQWLNSIYDPFMVMTKSPLQWMSEILVRIMDTLKCKSHMSENMTSEIWTPDYPRPFYNISKKLYILKCSILVSTLRDTTFKSLFSFWTFVLPNFTKIASSLGAFSISSVRILDIHCNGTPKFCLMYYMCVMSCWLFNVFEHIQALYMNMCPRVSFIALEHMPHVLSVYIIIAKWAGTG